MKKLDAPDLRFLNQVKSQANTMTLLNIFALFKVLNNNVKYLVTLKNPTS